MKNTAAIAGREAGSAALDGELADARTGAGRALGSDLESLIGNTPLVALQRVVADVAPVQILAKAEYANPGGSVKDRPALAMIIDGERRGVLTRDKTIIDATSGNTGIAYAMIGARRGYRVKLVIPANASKERIATLKAYGAELVLSAADESTDGSQRLAKQIVAQEPQRYFYPDQYNNPANWRAHYETTGPEIWRQTEGRITHFVAGVGTSGSFMGISRRLKELNPAIQCISMQPDAPLHGMEGLKHMATALVPGIYDPKLADQNIEVSTEDAQAMCLRLAREEGLAVGISAGGNVAAALQVARSVKNGVIVTILCDGAAKYLGEEFWQEPSNTTARPAE
jgi:cysteine synthase B